MRGTSTLVVAMLLAVTSARGAITHSLTGVSTPDMEGWMTYTLTLTTDTGMYLVGFTTELYSATFNQISPAGASTIFADNNGFFPFVGADPLQDTQFPFLANAGPDQEVGPGPDCAESGTFIVGSFALLGGANSPLAGTSVDLVQLVMPIGGNITGGGTVIEYDPATNNQVGSYNWTIPEPATTAIFALGALAVLRRRRESTRA